MKVYVIQGAYGYGWEDLIEEDTKEAAQEQLQAYNENEPQFKHRIITRREEN